MTVNFMRVLRDNHVQCPECNLIYIAFEKAWVPPDDYEELSKCECGVKYDRMKPISQIVPGSLEYTIKTILK